MGRQHLWLDKEYNSVHKEQELSKRDYMHIPIKKKSEAKVDKELTKEAASNRKKYSSKRWVVETTDLRHNKLRKLFNRYEKAEKYIGLF